MAGVGKDGGSDAMKGLEEVKVVGARNGGVSVIDKVKISV